MLRPFLALAFLFCCARLPAQETLIHFVNDPKTNTYVEVVSLFGKLPPSGCLPVRVTIANNTKVDRTVYLTFRSSDNFYGTNGAEVSSTFSASAATGHTETTDLTVPLVTSLNNSYGGNLTLNVDLSGALGTQQTNMLPNGASGDAKFMAEGFAR